MKKILCFGDSNTFGYIPGSMGGRFSKNERWSGILKKRLAGKFLLSEAGCNNRTAFSDNPLGKEYTGYKILPAYMEKDTYIVILALGINDLQTSYNTEISHIKNGIGKLIKTAKEINTNVKIILLCPNVIGKNILNCPFFSLFDAVSIEKSKKLPQIYKKTAEENNCIFVDLNKTAKVSTADGLHYEKEEHLKIAQEMEEKIHFIDKTAE